MGTAVARQRLTSTRERCSVTSNRGMSSFGTLNGDLIGRLRPTRQPSHGPYVVAPIVGGYPYAAGHDCRLDQVCPARDTSESLLACGVWLSLRAAVAYTAAANTSPPRRPISSAEDICLGIRARGASLGLVSTRTVSAAYAGMARPSIFLCRQW
jgi:hypothetical protein